MYQVIAAAPTGVQIQKVFEPANNFDTIGKVLSVLMPNAFVLAGLIAFILLIFGGLSVIMAAGSGDTKKMESGKKALTGAVTGLLIVIGSLWILQLVEKLTGVHVLGP